MFGYSEWIKFIRCLLKSVRTSGCIVMSEIGSHTNYATEPLYCPVHNIQEDLFCQRNRRERERAAWSKLHSHQQAWDQPSVHVCPLLQAQSLACKVSKDLSWCKENSGWLPSSCILLDISSHHQPDRPRGRDTHTARSESKNNLFLFISTPCFSWTTWWTCV